MTVFAAIVMLLIPSVSFSAVTCGAVTTDIAGTDRTSATIAYTTPAGSEQTLVVMVGYRDSTDDTVVSITHAGNAMTKKFDVTGTDTANTAFYYRKNPTSGTNNVVVTFTDFVLASGVVIFTCSGTSSSADPFRNAGNSATGTSSVPSVTVTDASNDITLDAMSLMANSTAPTEGANQTVLFAGNASTEMAMGVSMQSGGLGGVMSWNGTTSSNWVSVAAPMLPLESAPFMLRRRVQ